MWAYSVLVYKFLGLNNIFVMASVVICLLMTPQICLFSHQFSPGLLQTPPRYKRSYFLCLRQWSSHVLITRVTQRGRARQSQNQRRCDNRSKVGVMWLLASKMEERGQAPRYVSRLQKLQKAKSWILC